MSATKIGRQFVRFNSSTSATPVILNDGSALANNNGAYIRTGSIVAKNPTSATSFVLVAGPTAPTSVSDGRPIFLQAANSGVGAAYSLPYELEVPAGWGVWAIADSASWGVNITFDTVA